MIRHSVRGCITVIPVVAALLVAPLDPALAHLAEAITARTAWAAWDFTPDVVLLTGLAVAIYMAGLVRRHGSKVTTHWWRHALFLAGVAAVFLALESPIDPIAEHLFFVHQIQHLLLHMVGPMLLALSWPQATLTAGLPGAVKTGVLAPTLTNVTLRRVFGFLTHPAIVTVLFILSLYFWEIPRFHNFALLNEPVHYLMHVTMLVAGLLFWWRVFDRRPPRTPIDLDDDFVPWWRPFARRRAGHGLNYGVRLMMVWIVVLSNILLGAYTTLKMAPLYTAYAALGRLFGYTAHADEMLGGFVIWIPSSMMCLIAVLIVIHLWGLYETRMDRLRVARPLSNSDALLYPRTRQAVIERAAPKNRAVASGLVVFVIGVFVTAIVTGILGAAAGSGRAAAPQTTLRPHRGGHAAE
ncbi:MAG: cytochrome c oxidase assembly protein [Alphaproteobacteria bacterium]|nr:cytochrome c oxidase assembly protein [Alphaproteobacteria bacterium]MCB9928949.1 cytochrome c oxidase assembly protein [Alphaproteobacteria bacterium]